MAARGKNYEKGKNKQAYAPKPKIPPPHKRDDPAKDSICHKCGETRYWKRNCPQYLAELLKKKKNAASGAGGSDGIINRFVNNIFQVSRNNMVYFSAIPRDGIFEIDLFNSYTNESYIYAVSNKRANLDLDSALLWHCRLEHISKKRIEKLQHDGLLDSTDLKAFEMCLLSTRTRHALNRMCLYIDVEEHELGDHGEPTNYKAALLDSEFRKWLNAMNVEMQSMKDNEVWVLFELHPNGKTVGIDYEETFSPVADIRAIRILIAIAAYYDYEIWQMDTGYVFILNGSAVDWKSAKQSIFVTSSAEAEYIAAFDASKEAVWVKKFIFRQGVFPTIEEPISMYCDNTASIAIANESEITKGARYFHAKVYYLREVIEYGDIKLEKVHAYDNLADPFIKALAFPKPSQHTRNIKMLPASSLM
nr:hypothetical protein [Tanacetum cinerariifolium]